MLETIMTKASFSIWVYFRKHSRFTGQPEKGEAISLTRYGGKLFWTKNMWRGYSIWED